MFIGQLVKKGLDEKNEEKEISDCQEQIKKLENLVQQ